jgi:hypothetical protein
MKMRLFVSNIRYEIADGGAILVTLSFLMLNKDKADEDW